MFEMLGRSVDIVKRSAQVLWSEKKLLLFPMVSSIFLIGLLVSFLLPAFALADSDVPLFLLIAMFYFFSYFIIIFFNSALIHAAHAKMEGQVVSLKESLSFAGSKILPITGWVAIAATVGIILSVLRGSARKQRGIGGLAAGLVVGLIGMAWSLATFFVIPVMVFEGHGPISAIKRSVELIKKSWGESVVGGAGISMVFFILYLLGGGLLILSLLAGVLVPALLLLIPYFLVLFLAQGALQGIFVTAVYKYATTGKTTIFDPQQLQEAFRPGRP